MNLRLLCSARSLCQGLPVLLALALLFSAGCGATPVEKGPGNTVSGKITLKGQPVSGMVTFTGANKELSTTIHPTEGTYSLGGLVPGEYKVTVKDPTASAVKDTKAMVGMPGMTASKSVPPPAKYATPAGGLTFTVKDGQQTKDFELQEK